jgi:maltose/maltodextrin transport system substrate-binding protein
MMHRVIRLTLLSVALSIAQSAWAKDPLRLLVWINGDKGYKGLQKVGDAFAKVSGVNVIVQHPEAATDKFQQSTAAGKGPDIFCWAHDRTGEWAKAGLIVPVRPNKRIVGEIDDTAWQAFRYQNLLWGYPLAIEANGLIYNKALVSTPPATLEDIVKLDAQLASKGKKAILWQFNKSFFSWPLFAGNGGYIFARNDKGDFAAKDVGVNTPGAIAAGEALNSLITGGQMPKGARYDEMESRFNSGEVAMMINGPWAWDNARRSKIDFGVAPIPSVKDKPSKPFLGVVGCMIAAPSKVKDIAREFIEQHLLKPESLKLINDDVPLGVPANKVFYQSLSSDPLIRATMDNARAAEPIPNIPEMGRFWTAMDAALEAITNGLQSPKDALNAAAQRMKAR